MKAQAQAVVGSKVKPRTMWNPGDFNDNEIAGKDSQTDPSGYIPTEEMIARITRGEKVPGGGFNRYDIEAKSRRPLDSQTASNIIAELSDETEAPGFDLSDLPALQKKEADIKKRIASIKAEKRKLKIEAEKEKRIKEQADLTGEGVRSSNSEAEPKPAKPASEQRQESPKNAQD